MIFHVFGGLQDTLVCPLVCIGDLCTPGDSEAADEIPYIDDDDDSEGGAYILFSSPPASFCL